VFIAVRAPGLKVSSYRVEKAQFTSNQNPIRMGDAMPRS
jgi:hypothetical protein